MDRNLFRLVILILGLTIGHTQAVSMLPLAPEQQAETATAIFRGTVLQLSCFRDEADGAIYTKAILRVDEPLKGKFAANIQIVFRGGILDGEGEVDSSSPRIAVNEERLIFLQRHADGTLRFLNDSAGCVLLHRQNGGKAILFAENENVMLQSIRKQFPNPAGVGEDVSDQGAEVSPRTVGGLLESNGISSRFIASDRGEAIPYIVDAQTLPPGITLTQALNAVSNAFRAWSQVSSVKFTFEGTNNFGQAAANVNTTDRKIRVQLHDLYGFITGASTLGQGGRASSIPNPADLPNGGNGGKIGNREFYESTRGYLVLKHTQPSMQNLATFTEVLCHEIGHVLSLDHSSETNPEGNTTLKEAVMYFQVHADGRGATLGTYDPPMIRLVHPTNTPPFTFARVMDIVTGPSAPNVSGINEIELRGYDLQNDTLSISTTAAKQNACTFSVQGNKLKATPSDFFDAPRVDPASNSYYDAIYVRFSEASNASPYTLIRTISLMADSQSGASDGLPDSWMTQYFNTTTPSAGSKTRAQDDFDGDGVSNLNEFICGTVPTNAASVLKVSSFTGNTLQWIAKPYDLYEVQHSTNLTSWTLATTPSLVTSSTGSISSTNSGPRDFFRVQRVP